MVSAQSCEGRLGGLLVDRSAIPHHPQSCFAKGDRAIRILQVRQLAVDTFEDETRALAWLHEPNAAFALRSPIVHARTELGCRQIENELNRIDHGVLS